MVTTVPTNNITITMPSNETGSGATHLVVLDSTLLSCRTCRTIPGFGWGIALWGGTCTG